MCEPHCSQDGEKDEESAFVRWIDRLLEALAENMAQHKAKKGTQNEQPSLWRQRVGCVCCLCCRLRSGPLTGPSLLQEIRTRLQACSYSWLILSSCLNTGWATPCSPPAAGALTTPHCHGMISLDGVHRCRQTVKNCVLTQAPCHSGLRFVHHPYIDFSYISLPLRRVDGYCYFYFFQLNGQEK